MRILVTGSSGQIGSYVVDELRDRGHDSVGLDLEPSPQWTELVGDIRDAELVDAAVEGCDAVIHCAAQISVQKSIEDPAGDAEHNVVGTINLLEATRQHDLPRFVNVSSAAVYGEPEYLPIDEEHPTRPLSPYGQSKLAAEGYARLYRELHGLDVVTVRPFNVYSPRQDPGNPYSGVMSKFAERVKAGKAPIIFGDGEQTRDFVHAVDVAQTMVGLAAGECPEPPALTLNLGSGDAMSIRRLATIFLETAGIEGVEPLHRNPPGPEIENSVAYTGKMKSTGFDPKIQLKSGVAELLAKGR